MIKMANLCERTKDKKLDVNGDFIFLIVSQKKKTTIYWKRCPNIEQRKRKDLSII